MKKLTLILVLVLSTSISYATTLRTSEYTLKNPRIIIAGGYSASDNYSLTSVLIGSLTSGSSSSSNYSIDVTEADQGATDTLAPEITTPIPSDGSILIKGDTIKIECGASDNNLPLYFKTMINDTDLHGWSLTPEFNWDTANERTLGLKQITITAKDIGQNKTNATSEVYLIRKPMDPPQ